MSQRPPPPNSNGLYGFNHHNAGMGHMDPMSIDADEGLISMLDATMENMFNPFDALSMNLDNGDDLAMTTPAQPTGDANVQSLATQDETPFSAASVENMPGAGPSPSESVGAQAGLVGSGILTEFTKRRNWPAKVVEEVRDLLHILDANGRITYVSPNITAVTGHTVDDVTGRFLKDLIHADDQGVFLADLNESIASGVPMRMYYRLQKKDGTWAMVETVGHAHIAAAKFAPNPNNQTPFCQAVLMMSRPYPTKNASLLDSFLEHKIENERLKRRIADLRREEADDVSEAQRSWVQSQSDITQSEDTMMTASTNATVPVYPGSDGSMPPPERPSAAALNAALTRENLSEAAGSRPDSIKDKMARYEGASHADTIEMLTGLRYNEGERSRGITTGAGSPTLVKGDAGIAIPVDRDPRSGDKKKKIKIAEEYVCTDCGTLESPEWRKGPSGPKTLCNACGLRWAKKEKKRGSGVGTSVTDH